MAIALPMMRQLILPGNKFEKPRLPKKMIWTGSSVKMFRKCKRKWFWKHILGLKSVYRDKNLMIGSGFHEVLGEWYRGSRSSMAKLATSIGKTIREEAKTNAEFYDQAEYDELTIALDGFTGMMMGYDQIYNKDRKRWHIERESIEQKFKVDFGDFYYAGKIDLVYWDKKATRQSLCEHKTASRIDESYVERLPLDTQIRGYILGANQALGYKVDTVTYDVVRKSKLRRKSNETISEFTSRIADDYFGRPEFYFRREQLPFDKSDIEAFKYEIHQTHREYSDLLKQGAFDDPRTWMPNDSTCNDYFRLCEYHELCTTGLNRASGSNYRQSFELNEELSE